MPYLLTDGQKKKTVKVAKQLLKIVPKYDEKTLANVITEDETWVQYFEPFRKVSIKIWATKNSRRPVIAKCMLSAKKAFFLYAIFSGKGIAIQVPVKKSKSLTGKYYKHVVLKLEKYYQKQCPVSGFKLSDFYMIMSQPIRLPLLQTFCRKGR